MAAPMNTAVEVGAPTRTDLPLVSSFCGALVLYLFLVEAEGRVATRRAGKVDELILPQRGYGQKFRSRLVRLLCPRSGDVSLKTVGLKTSGISCPGSVEKTRLNKVVGSS